MHKVILDLLNFLTESGQTGCLKHINLQYSNTFLFLTQNLHSFGLL